MGDFRSGCLVCGAALEYLSAAEPVRCALCGTPAESATRCAAAHFVCDGCHSGSAKDVIERVCLASESVDPLEIARTLMRHPKLELHGPEHHFLVPAALLSAHANARGDRSDLPRLLAEARRRSDPVAGGFCGFQGACGAGIGAGIYVSLATGATPLASEPWALANGATARALDVLARVGGPRCCKRTTGLAILAAVRFARERLGVRLGASAAPCEWVDANAECIDARCPFYPRAARAR
jgi:LSD1 subclass zinc finger protein